MYVPLSAHSVESTIGSVKYKNREVIGGLKIQCLGYGGKCMLDATYMYRLYGGSILDICMVQGYSRLYMNVTSLVHGYSQQYDVCIP